MNNIGYSTQLGKCVCGDSLELLEGLPNGSVNLVMTSPPFALQRKKEYGNEEQSQYIGWIAKFAEKVFEKLADDGSFVIDIGGAYEKGVPSYSLYQFKVLIKLCDEIGFKLAQPFYWHNTSALPSPIEWVNKRKLRAKTSVNTIWWLCKDPLKCKANVSNVLSPYSSRMEKLISNPDEFLKTEGTLRPSGHVHNKTSWGKDNGGSIPSNMIQMSNAESNSQYLRYCKAIGIKGHPARYPSGLPEFFIKFLTDQDDLVIDIFGGSNTTGFAAEKLCRKWQSFEISKEYVAGSILRFTNDIESSGKCYHKIMENNFVNLT